MLSVPRKGFTQAVLASTMLLVSQSTFAAPLYVVSDLFTVAPTVVDAGPDPVLNAADTNVNNPLYIKAVGGSITAVGASAILVQNTKAPLGTPRIVVENSKTVQIADITSNFSAIEINPTILANDIAQLDIQIQKGAIVQASGAQSVILDSGTVTPTGIVLTNEGTLRNTGTGSVFKSGAQSTVTLSNTSSGIMQAGSNAIAVDLTNLAGPVVGLDNQGQIIANGASAIVSPNFVINGFFNRNTGTITGKNAVINLTGQATIVNNAGTITALDGPAAVAITTAEKINITGGAVTGIMRTTLVGFDSINFDLGKAKIFRTNGNLDVVAGGASGVFIASGTLELNNDVVNGNVKVGPGSTLQVSKNIRIAGTLVLDPGTVPIPFPGNINIDLTSSIPSAGVGVGLPNTNFGQILVGAATNIANAQINLSINGNGYIANQSTFKIIDSGNFALVTTNAKVNFPTSGVYSFATALNASNVTITVTRRALNNISDPNTKLQIGGIAGTLETLGMNNNQEPDVLRVLGELGRLPNFTQVEDALRQLIPSTNQMEMQPALSAPSMALDVVEDRLIALASKSSGYNAGGVDVLELWGQAFASHTDQKRRKGVHGYKNDTGGIALGADTAVMDSLRMGAGFSFATTGSRSKSRPVNRNDINTYQFILYGTKDFGCGWLDAMTSFANMKYTGLRRVNFGAINLVAKNHHRGAQWNSRVGYGYPFTTADGWDFIPYASLGWIHIAEKAYAENNAAGLNLNVFSHNVDIVDAGLKTKMSWTKDTAYGKIIPSWYAGIKHDFVSKRDEVNVRLISTGSLFRVVGLDPTRLTVEFGAGMSLLNTNGLRISLDYDAQMKKDVFTHTGYLNARYAL